jgi:hypothetical protein
MKKVTNLTGKPLTQPFSHFEIERNENAKKFVKIGENNRMSSMIMNLLTKIQKQ